MDKMKKALGLYRSAMDKIRTSGRRKTFTCISLILALVLLVSSTSAWFTVLDKARIQSDTFTMNASTGLRVNEGESISNVITIENVKLSEASSVDGRNMFFPTSRNLESAETSKMTFREGTVGDQNALYAYKNFTLQADSEFTYIYVKGYKVTVGDQVFNGSTEIVYDDKTGAPNNLKQQEECPIRLAFIQDSENKPTVIDPTALIRSYTNTYNAVGSTDSNGVPLLTVSEATPFSEYYFVAGSPIFSLVGLKELNVTLVVWLEGTGENFEAYADQPVSVEVELESNMSYMEKVYFVDGSAEKWVPNGNCFVTMTYKDTKSLGTDGKPISRTVVMSESSDYDNTWEAALPKYVVTDITFNRLNPEKMEIWNAWYTKVGINDETDRDSSMNNVTLEETREVNPGVANTERYTTYTIVRSNGFGEVDVNDPDREWKRLSPGEGYWNRSGSSGGTDTPSGGTTGGTLNVNVEIEVYEIGWFNTDVSSSGNYDLYVVFSDGKKEKMNYDNGKCISETIKVDNGTQIKGFISINRKDNTTKPAVGVDEVFTVNANNWTVSYKLGNYGRTAYLQTKQD